MNITKDKIEYISGDKVKTFKIPKEDRNINFKKWSFSDVIQYIKLSKEKKKRNTKPKKNKIKYARLRTVKDNLIISGRKTVNELKEEYILAANRYGANSIQAKNILDQINEYGDKIINPLYQEYLKSIDPNNPFKMTQNQFCEMLDRKFNELLQNNDLYYNYITNNKLKFECGSGGYNTYNVFSKLINKDGDYTFQIRNDTKIYHPFIIKNHTFTEVINKIKELCKNEDFKDFYKWENKLSIVKDGKDIRNNEETFLKSGLFPRIIGPIGNCIGICYDIFEYIMSKDDGKLRNKIFYFQYTEEKENPSFTYSNYVIINNDIIDYAHFIKYLMQENVDFNGKNLDLAFTNLMISRTLQKCGLNPNLYKDAFNVKEDQIFGTKPEKDKKLMEIEDENEIDEEEEQKKKELEELKNKRMKDKADFYNKHQYDDYYDWMNKQTRNNKKDSEEDFKMSEDDSDYESDNESIDEIEDKPVKPIIDVPKPIKPITTTDIQPPPLPLPPPRPLTPDNPFNPLPIDLPKEPPKPIVIPKPVEPVMPIVPYQPPIQPDEIKTIEPEEIKPIDPSTIRPNPLDGLPKHNNPLINPPPQGPVITKPEYEEDDNSHENDSETPTILNDDNSTPVPDDLFKDAAKIFCYCYYDKGYLRTYAIILANKKNELIHYVDINNYKEDKTILKEILMKCLITYTQYNVQTREELEYDAKEMNDELLYGYKAIINNYVKVIKNNITTNFVFTDNLENAKNKLDKYVNKDKIDLRGQTTYTPEYMTRVYFAENEVLKGGFEMPVLLGFIVYSLYNNQITEKHTDINIKGIKTHQKYLNQLNEAIAEAKKSFIDKPKNEQNTKIIKENILKRIQTDKNCEVEYVDNSMDQFINDLSKTELKPLQQGKGLMDVIENIKDFINFRKDVKETEYYLLQRIIKLESDMKTVKNKLVSNDIRTNLNKINYGAKHLNEVQPNNDDSDDWDKEGNGFNNGFTCSRCGKINPKFFNGNYPTLSEFRDQFSKL